jgi:hypothetical protein
VTVDVPNPVEQTSQLPAKAVRNSSDVWVAVTLDEAVAKTVRSCVDVELPNPVTAADLIFVRSCVTEKVPTAALVLEPKVVLSSVLEDVPSTVLVAGAKVVRSSVVVWVLTALDALERRCPRIYAVDELPSALLEITLKAVYTSSDVLVP